MSDMNIVVLPEPVGDDTPIRVRPDERASRQDVMAASWYGRSTTEEAIVPSSMRVVALVDSISSGLSASAVALVCHLGEMVLSLGTGR